MVDINTVADIVELHSWSGNESFTRSRLKEDLETALGDEVASAESFSTQVFEVLNERKLRIASAYPFSLSANAIRPESGIDSSSYLFCLGLSHLPPRCMSADARTQFENLAKGAASRYFGGDAIRIGSRWKQDFETYAELLDSVTTLLPDLGPPTQSAAPAGGDGGWDVLVVKNFSDRHFPRLIALGNCATGRTDWRAKGAETQPSLFWSYFSHSPVGKNVCLRFFAVPFMMDENDRLRKAGSETVTFDRMRLCEHSSNAPAVASQWIKGHQGASGEIDLLKV